MRWRGVVLVVQLGLLPAVAMAQTTASPRPEGKRVDAVFAAAREAFRAEDFEGAAELFARADQLKPSANTKFNEAQSWRRAGRHARAADAYAAALAAGDLDPQLVAAAERQLKTLEATLGVLELDGPAGTRATVAHIDDGILPLRLHLSPGEHSIRSRGPDGTINEQTVNAEAGRTAQVSVVFKTTPPPVAPAPVTVTSTPSLPWVLGWTALGLGAAGGVAAGVLGARFNSVLGDYEATGFEDTSLEDEALTLRTATNAVAFPSALLGTVGIILLLTTLGEDDDPTQAVNFRLDASRGTVGLRW